MKFKPTVPTKRNKKEVSTSAIDDALNSSEGSRGGFGERGRGRGRGRGASRGRGGGRGIIQVEASASGIFSLGPSSMSSRGRGNAGGGFAGYAGDTTSRVEQESSPETDINNKFDNLGTGTNPVTFPHISRTAGDIDPIDLSVLRKKIAWLTVKSRKSESSNNDEDADTDTDADVKVKDDMDVDTTTGIDPSHLAAASDIAMDIVNAEEKAKKAEKRKIKLEEETARVAGFPKIFMDDDAPAQHIFAVDEDKNLVSVADDELLFFQLPSLLPRFKQPESEKPVPAEDEEPESEDAKKERLEKESRGLDIDKLNEGRIGKLVIYKSGKMKLKIGDVYLDIAQGTRSTFLENVMVVDANTDQTKKAIELGHIVQKFVCAPDMDNLLLGSG
ncbi:RNA polymerase III RPC4-domain-containing protein [Phycomyces blakesleeanus]